MKNKRIPVKHIKKSVSKHDSTLDSTLKSSFLGMLITVGISLALLFASTAAALMTDDPTAFVEPIGYILIFIASLIGGFVCFKLNKKSPYLVSILCGTEFVLISMLFSLLLPHSLASGMKIWMRLLLHMLSLILFPIGTFMGFKMYKPQRKIKKRR